MSDRLNQAAVNELRKNFTGEILLPEHPSYDQKRKNFNGLIDRHPAIIAGCANVCDVVQAVNFGRENDLEIAVRSGGHSVAGWGVSDGGMVIDMRAINTVRVDPGTRTARVGGGAIWRDVDSACRPHSLATPGGTVPTVGVAGLSLSGGWGYLSRKFGLSCYNLLSAELVTASGEVVTASEEEHPDLFWALHGGGGNFGVATELTFGLHPLENATMFMLVFPPESGVKVTGRFRDMFEAGAPDELCGELVFMTAPSEEFVPSELTDKLSLVVIMVYAGPEPEARRAAAPLLELGPAGEMIMEMPYADIQDLEDMEFGNHHHVTSEHLKELPDQAVKQFCARAYNMPVPSESAQALSTWGGSISRGAKRWPMAGLDALWHVYPFGVWSDPCADESSMDWVNALRSDMAPYATGGGYLNLTVDEGPERTIAGYGGEENYRRLAAVKSKYDPGNLFRLNHNIKLG